MLAKALNSIDCTFSVGSKLQNIAFYTIVLFMLWIVIIQLKTRQRKPSK